MRNMDVCSGEKSLPAYVHIRQIALNGRNAFSQLKKVTSKMGENPKMDVTPPEEIMFVAYT